MWGRQRLNRKGVVVVDSRRAWRKRPCDPSPRQSFSRGREYWQGGGYKPIKANLQPSHGTKDSLLGKKISNNTKHCFHSFSFQKWSGNLFNRGTWSAINMGTACLRIYVIISQQLCRETVGNALPPKKRWWGNWIIRDKTQLRLLPLDNFTDKRKGCLYKGVWKLNKNDLHQHYVGNYVLKSVITILLPRWAFFAIKSFIAQYTSLCWHLDES